LQIPQVFPLAILMYPCYPHDADQEFLTIQYWSVTPTNKTPWSRLVLQLLKTPLLYDDQLLASTATEIGLPTTALANVLQSLMSTNPEIL
jgi:hypothetical protein